MKDCDELKQMFHARLGDAELPVNEGLWDDLQAAIGPSSLQPKTWHAVRWLKVAASLLLLLGAASVLLWLTQPQDDGVPLAIVSDEGKTFPVIPEPVTVAVNGEDKTSSSAEHKIQLTDNCQRQSAHTTSLSGGVHLAGLSATDENGLDKEEEDEMVHVQVRIRIQEKGFLPHSTPTRQTAFSSNHQPSVADDASTSQDLPNGSPVWALKAAVGTSLSKGDAHAPFTASLTAERKLNKYLAVEAGLQYHCLPHRGTTYHLIAVPARLQCLLAASHRMELYALAGGSAEKCVSGAPSNSFSSEPVRLAVEGGVGVRYRLSDQLALFAEPTLSHHFSTDSTNSSLRSERPTNFNLLCGLRMGF